jgi:1-deoxy-D-xylulose-5-phosphate synthase
MLDRAGLTGPDGPTHHGVFDFSYMRAFPNMTVMAPGDAYDLSAMLEFAIQLEGPSSLRYPKAKAIDVSGELPDKPRTPVQWGKAETLRPGRDAVLISCGTPLIECLKAASALAADGLRVGVINARFVKPLDTETILNAARRCDFVVTVEEAALMGGFGSAVLEAFNDAGVATTIHRLGIPDDFIEHGERGELLADLGLTADGIAATCRRLAGHLDVGHGTMPRQAS